MANTLSYKSFVQLLLERRNARFTGMISGVCDDSHSLQVGFLNGELGILSCSNLKGEEALQKMTELNQVRFTESPTTRLPTPKVPPPATRVFFQTLIQKANAQSNSGFVENPAQQIQANQVRGGQISEAQISQIDTIANRMFGPLGSIICDNNLHNITSDIRTTLMEIARELEASPSDASEFVRRAMAIDGLS